MSCRRCGRKEDIENHHIIARVEGGTDEPENKEELCSACHDFEHAKRNLLKSIEDWKEKLERSRKFSRRQAIRSRLRLYEHRLEVLESLNTPEQISLTGKYTSYWLDDTTHEVIEIPKDREKFEAVEQVRLL